jgi:glycosyltransferase involved in cell wall biosynthesis
MTTSCGTSVSIFGAIEAMKKKGHQLYILSGSFDPYYLEKLSKLEVRYFLAPLSQHKKNLVNFFICVWAAIRLIKKEKIDLIHSHHRWNCLIAAVAGKSTGILNVTSDHNILYGKKTLSFVTDGIITDSSSNREHLRTYFHVQERKIKVVPPLMSFERYNKLCSSSLNTEKCSNEFSNLKENGKFLVGQVARFSEEKGQEYFLDVIQEVLKEFKNVKFIFLGDGPLKDKFIQKAEKYGILSYISFLGAKNNVLDFLKVLDLFVISSNKEGFCLAATEAILSGLPIVATTVGGLPDQIIDGKTGFLVQYGDRDALKKKILTLLQSPQSMKTMGAKGREYLLRRYSYEKIADELESAYQHFFARRISEQ